MPQRKYFVLSFKFPSGLEMFFSDDYGAFALTPDVEAAVQWERGEDAIAYLAQYKTEADEKFLNVLEHMKVVPYGYD